MICNLHVIKELESAKDKCQRHNFLVPILNKHEKDFSVWHAYGWWHREKGEEKFLCKIRCDCEWERGKVKWKIVLLTGFVTLFLCFCCYNSYSEFSQCFRKKKRMSHSYIQTTPLCLVNKVKSTKKKDIFPFPYFPYTFAFNFLRFIHGEWNFFPSLISLYPYHI